MIQAAIKRKLIDKLLANDISPDELILLREGSRSIPGIHEYDLSEIIQRIYDLNNTQVSNIAAMGKIMAKVNAVKNSRRNYYLEKQIVIGFRSK